MISDFLINHSIIFSKVYRRIVTPHDGMFFFWERAKCMFKENVGCAPNYRHPKTFRDKLMWLARYYRQPEKTICADKYKVREYVAGKGLASILIPLVGVYDRAEEIDFEALPRQFVLKCNHGSGFNIIVLDKAKIEVPSVRKQLNDWLCVDFSRLYGEVQYKTIPRKIVCEQLLSETAPTEYQCWCLNGQPESLLVCRKNFDGSYDSGSFSTDFKQLYDRNNEKSAEGILERPQNLEKILEYSRILSHDFPFVRADFYEVDGKIYFAELTFTPNGNYLTKYKEEFHERLGKKLVLPENKIV